MRERREKEEGREKMGERRWEREGEKRWWGERRGGKRRG